MLIPLTNTYSLGTVQKLLGCGGGAELYVCFFKSNTFFSQLNPDLLYYKKYTYIK